MKIKLCAMILAITVLVVGCTNNKPNLDTSSYDNFPDKNIKIVVGYSSGGSSDKLARIVQPFLEKELGVSVVVENMPGAGGQIAATNLMRQDADGYMILAVNSPGIYYTVALQDTAYAYDDLYPLWIESYDPIVLLTLNDSEWTNLADFIEAAKSNPGKYSVGFAAGGGQQATAAWLKENMNLDIKLVSYDGGGNTSAALLGGHVDAIFGDAYARVDLKTEAKCLAIASESPNTVWENASTFNEQLKEYSLELPEPEFQVRYGAYWVNKKFVEDYPERAKKIVSAFEDVSKNEEYIQLLKDSGVYDSMVLIPGEDYMEQFKKSSKNIENLIPGLLGSDNN